MAKFAADSIFVIELEMRIAASKDFAHLRVAKRGDTLTLVSGPPGDTIKHARFRRVTTQWWELDVATKGGGWRPTFERANLPKLFDTLAGSFSWVLTDQQEPGADF
jgi:hypothetical protein